jgi:hypothetical protein
MGAINCESVFKKVGKLMVWLELEGKKRARVDGEASWPVEVPD